jgi:hypothetical protein
MSAAFFVGSFFVVIICGFIALRTIGQTTKPRLRRLIRSGIWAFFFTPNGLVSGEGGGILPCPSFVNILIGLTPNFLDQTYKKQAIFSMGLTPIVVVWGLTFAVWEIIAVFRRNNKNGK